MVYQLLLGVVCVVGLWLFFFRVGKRWLVYDFVCLSSVRVFLFFPSRNISFDDAVNIVS